MDGFTLVLRVLNRLEQNEGEEKRVGINDDKTRKKENGRNQNVKKLFTKCKEIRNVIRKLGLFFLLIVKNVLSLPKNRDRIWTSISQN